MHVFTKFGRVVTCYEGLPPIKSHKSFNMWSHVQNKKHRHSQDAYGHHTCQGGEILRRAPIYKFAWPFNEVVLWDHMTNEMYYVYTSRRPMNTKPGKVQTYRQRLST